jgi:Ca2+-transporting ATPase
VIEKLQPDAADARCSKLLGAYNFPLDVLVRELESNLSQGLSEEQVVRSRGRFGVNQLEQAPARPWWMRFLAQFQEFVIWILIVAAIISGLIGDVMDAIAILAIVLLNGVIGFFQQERAEQAISALRKLSAPNAKVFRAGRPQSILATELVPGDLLEERLIRPTRLAAAKTSDDQKL